MQNTTTQPKPGAHAALVWQVPSFVDGFFTHSHERFPLTDPQAEALTDAVDTAIRTAFELRQVQIRAVSMELSTDADQDNSTDSAAPQARRLFDLLRNAPTAATDLARPRRAIWDAIATDPGTTILAVRSQIYLSELADTPVAYRALANWMTGSIQNKRLVIDARLYSGVDLVPCWQGLVQQRVSLKRPGRGLRRAAERLAIQFNEDHFECMQQENAE